jgi:hypothetical protein
VNMTGARPGVMEAFQAQVTTSGQVATAQETVAGTRISRRPLCAESPRPAPAIRLTSYRPRHDQMPSRAQGVGASSAGAEDRAASTRSIS